MLRLGAECNAELQRGTFVGADLGTRGGRASEITDLERGKWHSAADHSCRRSGYAANRPRVGPPNMSKIACLAALASLSLYAQGPGRGIPDLTDRQTAALAQMNTDLAPLTQALNAARAALVPAPFTDSASIPAKAEDVRAAELALASARADAFAKIQASGAKFAPNQVAALASGDGAGRGGRGGAGSGPGGAPGAGPGPAPAGGTGGPAAEPAAGAPATSFPASGPRKLTCSFK